MLQRDRIPDFMQQPQIKELLQYQKYDGDIQKHAQSTKVMSFLALIRRTLDPIFEQKIFNLKAYNLEEDRALYEFSVDALKLIEEQVNEIKKVLENDQNIFIKKGGKLINLQNNVNNDQNQSNTIRGFNLKVFNQGAVADQQLVVQDSDIENEQVYMNKIYKFILQASQLINLFIFMIQDVDILVYLKKFTDQDRNLLLNITMSQIFQQNSSHLIVIKLLLSHIHKSYKDRARELKSKFSEFYDENDFKINYAQNKIEHILIRLITDGTISKQDESLQTKLKRLLRLNNTYQTITLEKIISKHQILAYYKNIPNIQDECQEIQAIILELVRGVAHKHFMRALKHLLIPIGMIDIYFRAQLQRALYLDTYLAKIKKPISIQSLSKPQDDQEIILTEREFLDCENQIITEFQFLCDVLIKDDTEFFKLDKKQISTMFSELIAVFKDYDLPTVHELVISNLYRHKLINYIYKMQSSYITEQSFDCPLLEKYIILYNCSLSKGERVKTIEYCLKLARFSFQDQQECGFGFILQELPISKRLEYLFEAQDQLAILQKESLINNNLSTIIKEYKSKCMESTLILKLQQIVFDCLYASHKQNDVSVQYELELIVRYQFDFQSLSDFVFTNGIYFAQLLVLDYQSQLPMNNVDNSVSVEGVYEEMIKALWMNSQELEQQWPNNEFLHQLLYLNENLINKDEYFSLECLIHFVEMYNYRNDQISWLPGFLGDSIKIAPIIILKHYIVIFMRDTIEISSPQNIYYFGKTILTFLQEFLDDAVNEVQLEQNQSQQIQSVQDLYNYRISIMNFLDDQIFVNMYQSDDNQDIVRLYTSVKIDFEELIRQNL